MFPVNCPQKQVATMLYVTHSPKGTLVDLECGKNQKLSLAYFYQAITGNFFNMTNRCQNVTNKNGNLKIVQQMTFSGISICMWNVRGLFKKSNGNGPPRNKLKEGEFLEQIKNDNIIGLVETHTGPEDHVSIEGYYTIKVDRPKLRGPEKTMEG